MAHSGINTYFAIDSSLGVLTNVSTYIDGVTPSSEPDDLDGTTFQPGVAAPSRTKVPGFRERGFSLSGKWTSAAETFFEAIEGMSGLDYEYGPIGGDVGNPKLSGTCSVLSYTGPVSTVDGVITFGVEISVTTKNAVGVFASP